MPFGNGKYESNDSTIQQLFIRYGALCARKQIQVTNVLLIDADVSKALVDYVTENEIKNLVLGASTRSGITRKFKNSHVGSSVMKRVPDFCSVHVISKGRVLERRLATRTLVNLSARPKISLSSELEDGNRSAAISHRSAPDMTMPHKRDVYETPAPVTFGSVHVVGHDLDVNFVEDSNENKTSASLSPIDLEAEMRRLKLELKQTMDMYNTAREEAIAAKKEASELHQLQAVERERLAEGAATEAIDKSKKLADIEAQRRNYALYRKYSIEEIKEGTNNFEPSLKIGEGGYGPVFKAKLDHTPVAIKVLRPDAKQGKQQFHQEVDILSRMRHPNLVLLLGACPEYGCLIYEFMNYGSLEDRLIRRNNTPPIPWQIRFNIAADIATGLLFLHQAKPEPLVHRDLKPGNILLDHNYVCKIADVGLARLVPSSIADNVTQYHMTSAAGTFCYIDPEYQQTGQLGVKSDVYSLGIMLLQIITARPPMGLTHIVGQAISIGKFVDVLDPTVPDWPVEEALTFANVALMCAKLMKKDRPDLGSFILPELDKLREFGMNTGASQDDYFSPMSDSSNPSSRTSSPFAHEERKCSSTPAFPPEIAAAESRFRSEL